MSNSRWAQANPEDLEALLNALDAYEPGCKPVWRAAWERIRASCPPLRTEAEVAAEALALLRQEVRLDVETWLHRLRALAKEPTRG